MGSKTFDGVWFISYADDHPPPHVHGRYGEATVVIDLLAGDRVIQSSRPKALKPGNAKRGDVKRILKVATEHAQELWEIWEAMHGTSAQ